MDLNGKVAIVTGAAQGIGVETAALLAQRGATVVLADIDERAVASAARIGPKAVFVRLDVTSESSWTDIAKQVMERFKKVNILVNNAGIFSSSMIVGSKRRGLRANVPRQSIGRVTGHEDRGTAYESGRWSGDHKYLLVCRYARHHGPNCLCCDQMGCARHDKVRRDRVRATRHSSEFGSPWTNPNRN